MNYYKLYNKKLLAIYVSIYIIMLSVSLITGVTDLTEVSILFWNCVFV